MRRMKYRDNWEGTIKEHIFPVRKAGSEGSGEPKSEKEVQDGVPSGEESKVNFGTQRNVSVFDQNGLEG